MFKYKRFYSLFVILLFIVFVAVILHGRSSFTQNNPKEATEATKTENAKILKELPFSNIKAFDDVKKGFIAPLPDGGLIKNARGEIYQKLS